MGDRKKLSTLKWYWLTNIGFKKSHLLPDPVKRTAGEIEAEGGG